LNPIDVVVDELNRLSEDEMSKEEIEEFHRIYYELIETEENKLD
jgi:hypothetical protein